MSHARNAFQENKKDIDRLTEIHTEVAGAGPGRKHDVEVLNRAAMVFITACWEAYVEDVATEGFDFLLKTAKNASVVPVKVRTAASKPLRSDSDERKVWELADDGWRAVVQQHRDVVLKRWVATLNTPKTEQVKTLFRDLLGVEDLSESWTWQNMTPQDAAAKLDAFIEDRGQIAHRLKHPDRIAKAETLAYVNHVERLVEKTDAALAAHLRELLREEPWFVDVA